MHFMLQDQELDLNQNYQESSAQIGYSCFICSKSIQPKFQVESQTSYEEAVLIHYLLNHKFEFKFEVGFIQKPNFFMNSFDL